MPVSLSTTAIGLAGEAYFWAALLLGLAYLGASLQAALRPGPAPARLLLLTSVVYLPLLFGALFVDRFSG